MNSKLFTYLKSEEDILAKMIENAEKQQIALVHFSAHQIEDLVLEQNYYAKVLRSTEELRIRLIMEDTGFSRAKASALKLSQLANYAESDEANELKRFQKKLRIVLTKLHSLNAINKLLSSRALRSSKELLSIFSKGGQPLCNAKI